MTLSCESGIEQIEVPPCFLLGAYNSLLFYIQKPSKQHTYAAKPTFNLFLHEAAQPVCGCQLLVFINRLCPECTYAGMLS